MPQGRLWSGDRSMFFKRLEIHGFKSFADPAVIVFDRGITCIVGPNGSGKSNICDAIRWVLGAKSAKSLRGEKMEDVIFAGTAGRRARGMAEVTLVLDNSDQSLDIEYSEVAITRRMYRSGESEYLINNNRCRMKDIRELIMDTGIGVEGYSIIGQGKISDIISSNTESIRQILEETAGIAMYRSRKEEAERRLSSADSNLERLGDITGELEGRLDGLREASEKAEKYIELRDRHMDLEVNITLRNIDDLEKKRNEIKKDIEEYSERIAELKRRRDEISRRVEENEKRRRDLDRLIDEARAEDDRITAEGSRLLSSKRIDEEKLISTKREKERLTEEIDSLKEKTEKEKINSKALKDTDWDAELEKADRAVGEKRTAYQVLKTSIDEKTLGIDDKKNDLIRLKQEQSSRSAEIRGLTSMKESLSNRRGEVTAEMNKRKNDLAGAKTALSEAERDCEEMSIRLQDERIVLEEKRKESRQAGDEAGKVRSEFERLRVEKGKMTGRMRAMEDMEANYDGFNNAVRFVMRSGTEGLHGVVADLLSVPEGMETAIETALGGAVQNIVCDDDRSARSAIELLKKNRAGRATFLPLSSIRNRKLHESRAVENDGGFLGYGSSCVEFDEKYRTIAEYLLGNVVVAKDIDSAVRMSKLTGSFRIVTLEGEIISQSGAVTGGRYRNKSAHFFERKSELSGLKKKISEMEKREDECRRRGNRLTQRVDVLETDIGELTEKLEKDEKAFFSKQNEITVMRAGIADSENSEKRWLQEIKSINDQQDESDRSIDELKKKERESSEAAEALEAVLEKDIAERDSEAEKAASMEAELEELRNRQSEIRMEKSRADAVNAKIEEALLGYRQQMESRRRQLSEAEHLYEEISARIEQTHEAVLKNSEKKDEQKKKTDVLQAEKEELISSGEEIRKEKDGADREADSFTGQKAKMEIEEARIGTRLENARNKLWDEFEISYMQALEYKRDDFSPSAAAAENRKLKSRIKELGDVNLSAIEEYKEVSERYSFLAEQRDDILRSKNELTGIISDMDRIIKKKFKASFDQIVDNFESVYRELYGGGHARIVLSDPSDPFGSEIEITAQPPGKQLESINLLSGGEKTMTAIALMFAVLRTKPTPCCILDEIEAALDENNLNIFGEYVKNFKGVQFTLITHQKATMEHADIMYGITMPENGVSKVYSLRMD